ncbi:MAG TPA: RNA 2',3'-cyclic phosphodiesterase [Verrucomicrobiae bacterium]|nr:RNA 2',3'-cyclic phosphodiesterase [Verrucomicrobiae bacterium]
MSPIPISPGHRERSARLFAAIALGEAARAAGAAVAARLQAAAFAARYEDPAKYHITLAFLGNVERSRTDDVAAALASAARQCERFALELDKLGAFPHERKPRIVYIGARDAGPGYRALSTRTRAAFAGLGFTFEGDAVAHVTIARVKEPVRPLPAIDVAPFHVAVDAAVLLESFFDAAANTSHYTVVATAPLAAEAV